MTRQGHAAGEVLFASSCLFLLLVLFPNSCTGRGVPQRPQEPDVVEEPDAEYVLRRSRYFLIFATKRKPGTCGIGCMCS